MQQIEPLIFGKTYHIYNRGINGCDLFRQQENYEFFIQLHSRYISQIADTFAWVMLKNHFHMLVRIKDLKELYDKSINVDQFLNFSKPPYQHFSNMFNAYTKAFNNRYNRTGNLFEHRFHRKPVSENRYFRKLVVYIHLNPVKHNFAEHPIDYPWSTYKNHLTINKNGICRETVMGWFDGLGNFISEHNDTFNFQEFDEWLGFYDLK